MSRNKKAMTPARAAHQRADIQGKENKIKMLTKLLGERDAVISEQGGKIEALEKKVVELTPQP